MPCVPIERPHYGRFLKILLKKIWNLAGSLSKLYSVHYVWNFQNHRKKAALRVFLAGVLAQELQKTAVVDCKLPLVCGAAL